MAELTPVEIAESAWSNPQDAMLSGLYRVRLVDAPEADPDHLIVYLRGFGGDAASEYRAPTTICGLTKDQIAGAVGRGIRLSDACEACMTRVGTAFEDARAALAGAGPGSLE